MRLRGNTQIIILILICLSLVQAGTAQDTLATFRKLSEYFPSKLSSTTSVFSKENLSKLSSDSLIKEKLFRAVSLPDTSVLSIYLSSFKTPKAQFSSKPFLRLGRGYIGYQLNYRSGNDSSLIENNLSQHLITGSFSATIAQTLPLRITYFERRSNSPAFKNFRDVCVDVDVDQYKQLKAQRMLDKFRKSYEGVRDPLLPFAIQMANMKSNQFKDLLNDPKVITELIRSKETLARKDFADTSMAFRDSATGRARKFIDMYDSLQSRAHQYAHLKDSLQTVYQDAENKIAKIQQLLSGKKLSAAEIEELAILYGKRNKDIQKLQHAYSGIKKLSVGQTLPNFSNLTLQNINVNGLNIEYSRNRMYLAATAGIVDFRIRDFLFAKQQPAKQYVFSARIGYGTKERDNIILTYFRGKKQLFGGNLQTPSSNIQGVSLSGQLFIVKQVKLYGEIAQSGASYAQPNNFSSKPAILLSDNSQRAYAIGFSSYLSKSQTSAEGYYQHTGVNYQSFNSFQYNSTSNSWAFRFEQLIWKRQLAIQAAFRKNDFVNPLVPQRYDANTVFKNLTLTFRKYKWPVLSMGYLPASQYTAIGSQVYENHYQAFTGNVSHQYRLGIIKAGTLVSFSRFFNNSSDSGFVYYNSRNFFLNQTFLFSLFTATVNVSCMKNNQHQLIVMEEGVSATLFKKVSAAFTIKINNLNQNITRVGFNAKTRAEIKGVGELNLWMEQSFLPSRQDDLYKYEMYNIGLIRYFN